MAEEYILIAVKIREAAEQARISKASCCAKCEKTCPRVAALLKKYTEKYTLIQDNAETLQAENESLHTQITDPKRQIFNIYPEHDTYNETALDAYIDSLAVTGAKIVTTITTKPKPLFLEIN